MGQKVDPRSFRLQVTKNWGSQWIARGQAYRDWIVEDTKKLFQKSK